jgi:hypothetical protein
VRENSILDRNGVGEGLERKSLCVNEPHLKDFKEVWVASYGDPGTRLQVSYAGSIGKTSEAP